MNAERKAFLWRCAFFFTLGLYVASQLTSREQHSKDINDLKRLHGQLLDAQQQIKVLQKQQLPVVTVETPQPADCQEW